MRKRQPCDGCESLKQLAEQIDDEPEGPYVQFCFTCGRSRIVPDPGLLKRLAYYGHELLASFHGTIAKVRKQRYHNS
jgi:hypothetical protein